MTELTDPHKPCDQGLTSSEAAVRLAADGPNAIPERRTSAVRRFLTKLTGPVPWMLEAALVLEIVLRKGIEAAIIVALLLLNAAMSFAQERRASDALTLLRQRLRVLARVRRGGTWGEIPAEDLVIGDLVHVRVGDFVPADVRLVDGDVLLDQSSVTGESAPVEARAEATAYSGSVVRRGEASGIVIATGTRSKFGKTAEMVSGAKAVSHPQSLILSIVKYLVVVDGGLAVAVAAGAAVMHMSAADIAPFVLMLLVASVPVALPATFTLAGALGALELSSRGVLVTRLAAIEEAAGMQVLCSDKTGTLTENRLSLGSRKPLAPHGVAELLRLAAAACDEATQDPLDLAILREAGELRLERLQFAPFDPSTKRAEATVRSGDTLLHVVKGAPQVVGSMTAERWDWSAEVTELAARGERVLAVAAGSGGTLHPIGLLGFVDPPRQDAASLVSALRSLGVRLVMVTGDTAATAKTIAQRLGIGDRVGTPSDPSTALYSDVLAGVLPEDKLHVVQALQRGGSVVGMTGDGVNDAPALKQAEVGIAVSAATDVAKAAASLVLTRPGLGGVLDAVETGRRIYQRMLTYTLNKIVKTFEVALFLTIGFFATGALVTTPRLVLLLLLTNDFVTMSIAGDRVVPSRSPDRWQVGAIVATALALACGWLLFSLGALLIGRHVLALGLGQTQTLAFLLLVFGGQANVYLVRERRALWRSMPSPWMLLATCGDLIAVSTLALAGALMTKVAPFIVIGVAVGAISFMLMLDRAKVALFRRVRV